jgi:hypothetical protein
MMKVNRCAQCGCEFYLPDDLYRAAKCSEAILFYCPYGHPQHFPNGPTALEKMRQERDLLAQRIAQKDDEIKWQARRADGFERVAKAEKAKVTKLTKRAKAGVCPCCHRQFAGMARHMKTKHPEFKADAGTATH